MIKYLKNKFYILLKGEHAKHSKKHKIYSFKQHKKTIYYTI